jgi:ribonuclease P protein component
MGRKKFVACFLYAGMCGKFIVRQYATRVADRKNIPVRLQRKMQMEFSTSLKKNEDFRYVYRNGKVKANRYLVMYVVENNQAINRLGISASKKTGNSVVRHHFYRLVRESYRLHEKIFNSGLDIVVVAKKSAADVGFKEIESALLHLAKLHHIIMEDKNFKQ